MPGRLSAYAFILSGAVLFAIASAFAGAQSRPAPLSAAAEPGPQGASRPAPVKSHKPLAALPARGGQGAR